MKKCNMYTLSARQQGYEHISKGKRKKNSIYKRASGKKMWVDLLLNVSENLDGRFTTRW